MNIGKRDRRIILQKPNLISDGAGGWKPTTGENKWVTVITVWAEFMKPRFSTIEAAGAIASVSLREIKIMFFADVVKGWRILYGLKIFTVDHTYDIARTDTVMVCKEVVK